jgi:hypothetical protein
MPKDRIFETSREEGKERPAALVVIPGIQSTYLCNTWGTINGQPFFDMIDGTHVELHGALSFILHVPLHGFTFQLDGKQRELRSESLLVVN